MTITTGKVKQAKTIDQEQITLPDFTDTKIPKYFFENLFIGYIGPENEIQEITILQKETDKNNNTIYYDLISRNKYTQQELKKNEITIPKRITLLSMLNNDMPKYHSIAREKVQDYIKTGYLTDENLITIYNIINDDIEYKIYTYSRGNSSVYYNCPSFCIRHKDSRCIPEQDDETLTKLILNLTTSNKISVLTGDKGIGKSILKTKLNYFKNNQLSYFINKEIWAIDYNSLKEKNFTKKHIEKK